MTGFDVAEVGLQKARAQAASLGLHDFADDRKKPERLVRILARKPI